LPAAIASAPIASTMPAVGAVIAAAWLVTEALQCLGERDSARLGQRAELDRAGRPAIGHVEHQRRALGACVQHA